jgi:hypothetical protein
VAARAIGALWWIAWSAAMLSFLFKSGPFFDQFGPGVEPYVFAFWIVGGYVCLELLRRVVPWAVGIVTRRLGRSGRDDRG